MRSSIILLVTLLLFSNASACSDTNIEDFQTFFSSFKAQRKFAKQSTKYPYVVHNHTEIREWDVLVGKNQDKNLDSLDEAAKKSGMIIKVETVESARAKVKVYAQNTGYSIRYNFIIIQGCWYLSSVDVNDF